MAEVEDPQEVDNPPTVGEQTDQVLADLLKFSPQEIQKLREKKII